jgi:predicted transcriptional regulator of viral defense system
LLYVSGDVEMRDYLREYIEGLQSNGRYSFSLGELRSAHNVSNNALAMALHRHCRKGKIVCVRKGFYVIVPPEYSNAGIMPPSLFIDDMMAYIGRDYYVGLLSAAVFHGATHQQPQEVYIVTGKPALRSISVKGIRMNFITRNVIPEHGIEQRKTDTGYVNISSPELTALDLIQFRLKSGGIARAVETIEGFVEQITANNLRKLTKCKIPMSVFQRLGFILESTFRRQAVADSLHEHIHKKILRFIPLEPSARSGKAERDNRWKVVGNVELEQRL